MTGHQRHSAELTWSRPVFLAARWPVVLWYWEKLGHPPVAASPHSTMEPFEKPASAPFSSPVLNVEEEDSAFLCYLPFGPLTIFSFSPI